jgi:hypothetical protein
LTDQQNLQSRVAGAASEKAGIDRRLGVFLKAAIHIICAMAIRSRILLDSLYHKFWLIDLCNIEKVNLAAHTLSSRSFALMIPLPSRGCG